MFHSILVPVDGSDDAEAALPTATAFARRFGASLLLLEVVPTSGASLALAADVASGALTGPSGIDAQVNAREEVAEGYVSALIERLTAEGLTATYEVISGDVESGILDVAEQEGADLIIMASRGRGGLGRLVFGSTSDHVVRNARVPVIVVPPNWTSGRDA